MRRGTPESWEWKKKHVATTRALWRALKCCANCRNFDGITMLCGIVRKGEPKDGATLEISRIPPCLRNNCEKFVMV